MLVASLGLDYEEGSCLTLCKLVQRWSAFPDEPEAGRNQSTWSMKIEVWKAESLDRVSKGAATQAMSL